MALLAPAVLAKATAAAVPPFRPFDIKEVHSEDPRRLPRPPPPPRPLLLLLSLPLCDAQRKAPSVKSELGVRTGLRAVVRPARPPAAAAAELWARAREGRERSAVKAFFSPPPPLSPLLSPGPRASSSPLLSSFAGRPFTLGLVVRTPYRRQRRWNGWGRTHSLLLLPLLLLETERRGRKEG